MGNLDSEEEGLDMDSTSVHVGITLANCTLSGISVCITCTQKQCMSLMQLTESESDEDGLSEHERRRAQNVLSNQRLLEKAGLVRECSRMQATTFALSPPHYDLS